MPTKKEYFLGSAVKLTAVLNIATATTATITIDDPTEAIKVNAVAMTKDADKIYSYVYQSASTDEEGVYVVTISITYNGYTCVTQDTFTLLEQE